MAHSRVHAEKSGAVRERYNAIRAAGAGAFRENEELPRLLSLRKEEVLFHVQQPVLRHVVTEALRVGEAVEPCSRTSPNASAGCCSNRTLRSATASASACPRSIAWWMPPWRPARSGARLTGAGFGGCAVIFCLRRDLGRLRAALIEGFYSGDPAHVIDAEPGGGAVHS